ncbi:amidohydrolase family protein [Herbiconiux moechotypicola]|uniref:Amidohydrolase family protein n=1 Tax=Herbiconiux moechotypicola TaxID=637393 RepID=A0ABP5QJ94_9MICO|nr:amidohydrolase family protein [Herbiconiux moechotypicola]MCS5730073.1 amidohydrolase family protein [Herbiconiux moechotypicola]
MTDARDIARREVLVRGAWVITQGPLGTIADAAVHLRGGAIVEVGDWTALRAAHPELDVVGDGTGIVAPGFVNTHTHLSEALATGMGSELTLFEWGERIVGPLGAVLTQEDAAEGTALRAVELLLSGVTTVNDMFVHCNPGSHASVGVVDGIERSGLRAVVSFGAEDVADPALPPWAGVDEVLAEQFALERAAAEASARQVQAAVEAAATGAPDAGAPDAGAPDAAGTGLVSFRYGVGTLLGQSDALLAAGVAATREHGWAVHTHLAETREELVVASQRWRERTIDHADTIGLLDGPLIAGHAVWATDRDVQLLAERGTAVAHNPVANMILGSGVCPVPVLRRAGVLVGVATDGAASNDSQDMLQAVKMAALLQKVHHIDPSVIDASTVLRMATIDGARALGLDHLVGSLEPGKRADVVLYQDTVDVSVLHDPEGQLVYGASPRSVAAVFVDGRMLVSDHRCVSVDEAAQIERCRPLVRRIARASALAAEGWSRA